MEQSAQPTVTILEAIFPLLAVQPNPTTTHGFLGTGFFVNRQGVALTALHLAPDISKTGDLRAALPAGIKMAHQRVLWGAALPGSDIAVIQVDFLNRACFKPRFEAIAPGQDVHTWAIPESMLEKDAHGTITINTRVAKGYISHGTSEWVAASFALPKGMSGAPIVVNDSGLQQAAGVFVGQNRGEEIEDYVTEIIDEGPHGKRTEIEKTARIEYFARGELLSRFKDYSAPEFKGKTLCELIDN